MRRSRRVERYLGSSVALTLTVLTACASGGDGTGRDTGGGGGGMDAPGAVDDGGDLDGGGETDDAAVEVEDDAAVVVEDDAAMASIDAYVMPGTDAFVVPPDAFVVPMPDAFVPPPDAYVLPMADAFVPPPDAYRAPDAYVIPDAYTPPPDAFVPPDAYRIPDAYVVPDAYAVCALPSNACADGAETRDRCAGARVIGRRQAAMAAGYTATGNTCTASNRFDDCSWDAGNDHAYRIWLRAGERVSARITARAASCFDTPAITLKLYESLGCSDVTCSGDRWCHDFVSNGETFSQTAVRDGWMVIVVDGSTAFDDEGQYTLNVTLTNCAVAGCEC